MVNHHLNNRKKKTAADGIIDNYDDEVSQRKIWNSTERVIKIILKRMLWEILLQYHFQPKITKEELVHEKVMNNRIYSYLFISKSKHDPHNNISAQKTVCIIRKLI